MNTEPPIGAYTHEEAYAYDRKDKDILPTPNDNPTLFIETTLRRYKKDDAIIIDIGSGARVEFMRTWADAVGGQARVVGYEPSEHMRAIAHSALKTSGGDARISICDGSWGTIPAPDESADFVVGRFSFHHTEYLEPAYRELHRILKPGGKAVFAVPHPKYCEGELKRSNKDIVPNSPMTVSLFGTSIRYFYHPLAEYFDNEVVKNNFTIVQVAEDNWSVCDGKKSPDTNTLLFAIEKR